MYLYYKYTDVLFLEKYFVNYKIVNTEKLKISRPRNVILIFAESFEKVFSEVDEGKEKLRVDVEDALVYDGFVEGYGQHITFQALYAAFKGEYQSKAKKLERSFFKEQEILFSLGKLLPEDVVDQYALGLGNVFSLNGYQLLFAQGGDIDFMGTDNFLREQHFDEKNVYGRHNFEKVSGYKEWWGVQDKYVFELFSDKISMQSLLRPFFAVMFTLDLHYGENPYFGSLKEIQKSTIQNLNQFVEWFRKQPFYENTTLIIVGDHRRMGENQNVKRELFNAFYNLPEHLKEKYNNKRRFNHIDLCPSIMEIAGVDLPENQYGLGVSIFSDKKTMEERLGFF